MPYLTKTQCNYSRCSASVEHGKRYCPKHIKDKPGNESNTKSLYHNSRYRNQRDRYVKDNPYCNECERLIQEISNRHLDHRTPWQTGSTSQEQQKLFWDEENWQTLCPKCHSTKTAKESRGKSKKGVTIVFGPPLAGKTTYVLNNKEDHEVIVDFDLLFQALTGNKMHHRPESVVKMVLKIREDVYSYIHRNPTTNRYWVITTQTKGRQELIDRFNAESIIIDPGKETCMKRLRESHRDGDKWEELINEWYNNFESMKGERIIYK